MIEWLIIGVAGSVGIFAARKSKPVKAATTGFKNWIVKSKTGKSFILNNAEDNIRTELDQMKEQSEEERISIEIAEKQLKKQKEELEFLQFVIDKKEIPENQVQNYKDELDQKQAEYEIQRNGLSERKALYDSRIQEIESYEKGGAYSNRLVEAAKARRIYETNSQIESAEQAINKISSAGEGTVTTKAIMSVTGRGFSHKTADIGNRQKLLEEFRKRKNDSSENSHLTEKDD